MRIVRPVLIVGVLAAVAVPAVAWDPASGDWSKSDPRDLRVMTWNVLDGINRLEPKTTGLTQWDAIVRTVAAMKPDVLLLQETGDTGSSPGDSVAQLTTTLELFIAGGIDPFRGNVAVTSYVQLYDPSLDYFIFVSDRTDNFNRNVILSRYPFADLNGDGKDTISDIPFLFADLYAPGGSGGIRGFMFAEIDLPDGDYAGELVVGNAHLKSGGQSGDLADRLAAAQNVAYFIDYGLNGADAGTPDPRNKMSDLPQYQNVLGPDTPVIIGGDWNEDEQSNGRRGPAEWLTRAATNGGTDGTDADRSDMLFDDARDVFNNSRATQSNSKLDYIAWQDSKATQRRSWIFNAANIPSGNYPPEFAGFSIPQLISTLASDHRAVTVDFILPAPAAVCDGDLTGDSLVDFADFAVLSACFGSPCGDLTGDALTDFSDFAVLSADFGCDNN